MPLFRRRETPAPEKPKQAGPSMPDAWVFTLRSVPRHYEPLKAAIESTGEARVYFGEALAYIRGQGVALFRVEASGLGFVDALYAAWRDLEIREAFQFDVNLYVFNTEFVANLKGLAPEEAKALIREHAPTYDPAADPRVATS
jgi:hypothetical protein